MEIHLTEQSELVVEAELLDLGMFARFKPRLVALAEHSLSNAGAVRTREEGPLFHEAYTLEDGTEIPAGYTFYMYGIRYSTDAPARTEDVRRDVLGLLDFEPLPTR